MAWFATHPFVALIVELVAASGFGTIVTAYMTHRLSSGKQADAEPNGARQRLADEVSWLRRQLEVERARKR